MTFPALGIQSWSLRHFTATSVLLAEVRALDCASVELCGVHANFNDPAAYAPVLAACRTAGVRIRSMGVQTFTGNEAVERRWFDFARAAGVEVITCHFQVATFHQAVPIAVRLAEEYGVRLAIHCHGGYMFGGSVDVISHLLELGGSRLGVCIDTAWCIQAGGDPVQWIERWNERIYGMHFKDFTFTPQGRWVECPAGAGTLDLAGALSALNKIGFQGTAVVEYEADKEAPQAGIRASLDRIAAALG